MRTTHRNYSEEAGDFNRLCRFVIEHNEHVRACSTWSLGRIVDWKYGLYGSKTALPDFCGRNAQLWFDGFGELAGFAISEDGVENFTIITLLGYQFLVEDLLDWVLASWAERRPRLTTEVTEQQVLEAELLERRGFRLSSTFSTQRFDLKEPPSERFPLEAGFSIVDMHTHPNYREQRALRHNAFSGKDTMTEEELQHELEFYNYTHQGPIYHPQCDLCVMAPDGRFVAGCEALIDARNAEADIERVCTHSDFRRRGFARAAIQECLDRLRQISMRRAYITGYSPEAIGLYGSLGAASESKSFIYELSAA